MAWLQATLPIRLGGLGLREAVQSSPAAYVGSCNSTRKTVQDFQKRLAVILKICIFQGLYYQETPKAIFRFVTMCKTNTVLRLLDFSTATQRQIQSEFDSD